jgi:hypothetical protein
VSAASVGVEIVPGHGTDTCTPSRLDEVHHTERRITLEQD